MRVQHNLMAMNAYRSYAANTNELSKNLEKLSSGYKINRAGDNAAGLAISEKMRAQITGLDQAQDNAKDGISLVQTAEGALTEVHDMLNRMVELATQSANGTYDNDTDRANLQKEMDQLRSEVDRIADSSNFNGIQLLDGTLGLNRDAFDVAAVAPYDGTGAPALTGFHPEQDAIPEQILSAQPYRAARFDFGDLAVAVDAGETGSVTFTLGGRSWTESLPAGDHSAYDIGRKLLDIITKPEWSDAVVDPETGLAPSGNPAQLAIRLGGGVYSLSGQYGDGNKEVAYIHFSLEGYYTNPEDLTGYVKIEDKSEPLTEEQAALNAGLELSLQMEFTNATVSGNVDLTATNVFHFQAPRPASLASADLTLTPDMIHDGAKLTIDGQTFTFKTDAGNTALTGPGVIDVSGAKTDVERIHLAADLLSQQAAFGARGWKISSKSGGVIHIEQTVASAGDQLSEESALVDLIKFGGVPHNAGAAIAVTQEKIAEGDVLIIDGRKYVFTADATKLDGTADGLDPHATYVDKDDAVADLAQKIRGNGGDARVSGSTVTVYAAAWGDPAPQVLGDGLTLQIGDTSDSFNQLKVDIQDMHVDALKLTDVDVSTQAAAQASVDKIKDAINTVSSVRGDLGATQNRLDHTINNLSVMEENIQDAESSIRDTDVAEEMMAYTKNNILIQSAQAMLAQANAVPQGVLQLLQ